ncbi:MAG TPA: hypothetical protein VNS58_19020 [Puia sp.]|nr:hypothetical protein [Puia sp.]
MKSCLITFLLCAQLLQSRSSRAQSPGGSAHYPAPEKSRLHFSLLSGYQHENFRWSIAGNTSGTNPNIYSELIWKNLAGPLAGIEGEWNCWKSFSIRSAYSRLFIVSGAVTDMDYQGDNRTNRVYNGAFDSNKGSSSSWRTTLEYKIEAGPSLSLIPGLGYALHTQSLFLLSDATVGNNTLHSTYATTYKGATLAIRAVLALDNFFSLEPSLFYDQVHFRGRADWNLIPTFQHPLSFEDIANGYNIEAGLKGSYLCNDHFSLFLSGNYLYGNTGKGTDRLYQTNGQEPLTQFNGAIRHFWGLRAGLKLNISCIFNGQSETNK